MMKKTPYKIAILGSTRGTALKPVIKSWKADKLGIELTCVVSDRPEAPILLRAKEAGIPGHAVPRSGRTKAEQEKEIIERLREAGVDLVLLVGFMRILSAEFVSHWPNRILNIHPSLLPRHKGLLDLAVHRAVLENGEPESGCTLHAVTAEVDAGPILIQESCPVIPEDSPETLKEKVQNLEKQVLLRFLAEPDRYLPKKETNA